MVVAGEKRRYSGSDERSAKRVTATNDKDASNQQPSPGKEVGLHEAPSSETQQEAAHGDEINVESNEKPSGEEISNDKPAEGTQLRKETAKENVAEGTPTVKDAEEKPQESDFEVKHETQSQLKPDSPSKAGEKDHHEKDQNEEAKQSEDEIPNCETKEPRECNTTAGENSDDQTEKKVETVEKVENSSELEESKDKQAEPPKKDSPSGFGSFGSGAKGGFSAFSSGFSMFSKASGFSKANGEQSKPHQSTNEPEKKEDEKSQLQQRQDVKTGEEGEETKMSLRVRLYVVSLVDQTVGWKERGVGLLRLNANREGKHRLVLRADGNLRVALNLALSSTTQVYLGFPSSLSSEKVVRVTGVDNDGTTSQFAMRCASAEAAQELYDVLKTVTE